MSKRPEEYLKHILDEIEYLLKSSKDINEDRFMDDETLQRAYSRSLEIIGEAANRLPKEFTDKHSEIEWGKTCRTLYPKSPPCRGRGLLETV